MIFFKVTLVLSSLLILASAMTLERNVPAPEKMSVLFGTESKASGVKAVSFSVTKSDCEKEDEDDCKEFCSLSDQTATCRADGNKVTCYCKGGKSESNCEERCLLCMPDKSSLQEARRVFNIGKTRIEDI